MKPPTDFPVLWQYTDTHELEARCCPRFVPWSFVAPHEAQALANHGQTLRRLAARGGLSPAELLAVVSGKAWRDRTAVTDVDAVQPLLALLDLFVRRPKTEELVGAFDAAREAFAFTADQTCPEGTPRTPYQELDRVALTVLFRRAYDAGREAGLEAAAVLTEQRAASVDAADERRGTASRTWPFDAPHRADYSMASMAYQAAAEAIRALKNGGTK